jgi:hypothetical protein
VLLKTGVCKIPSFFVPTYSKIEKLSESAIEHDRGKIAKNRSCCNPQFTEPVQKEAESILAEG